MNDPNSSGTAWYGEAALPAPERPTLTFDLDVDVCVVGGGLAGLTTAREIARRGWSVAVLEAKTVGSGASGRNLGFVLPGFLESIDRIIERVGLDHAKELWALSERGVEYVRQTIRETKMPGVKPVNGWLEVAKFREDPELEQQATLLRDKFASEVEHWPAEQVQEKLKSPLYCNAIHFPRAFHINPLNYVLGLAAAAEQAGVRIFEHTPAVSLDPSGVRKRIGTPSARVRAPHVVLAGSTGMGTLVPRLAGSLLPVTSYMAATAPLGDKLKEALTYTGGVSDTDFIDNHYRIIDRDCLICNGGLTMWQGDARRYARRLGGDLARIYPQLGKVEIEHVWAATAGSPVHKMPQVGEVARGLWVSNGYGGQGFNTSAAAAEVIARGVVDGDDSWQVFSRYDLVWAGGAFGRAAMQVMYSSRRMRERLDAQFSRPADMQEMAAPPAADTSPVAAAETASAVSAYPAPEPEAEPGAPPLSTERKAGQRRRKRAKKRAAPSGAETEVGPAAEPAGEPVTTDLK